ncbi:hypothetical protein SK128_007778 [Halocaridina rubra]|uniref:C-type lectin domain-containing protein n=1 Tax=Halocaridina rubra TaxID=373956 RepID=A0AAN9AF07_HALRR
MRVQDLRLAHPTPTSIGARTPHRQFLPQILLLHYRSSSPPTSCDAKGLEIPSLISFPCNTRTEKMRAVTWFIFYGAVIMIASAQNDEKKPAGGVPQVGSTGSNETVLEEVLNEVRKMNNLFKIHLPKLSCPPPFFTFGSECLYVIREDMSWEDARSRCQNMGADLVVPNNIQELKLFVGNRYPRKNTRNFWIGGKINDKVWQWLSGSLVDERLWHTNEPSGNGDCLAMFDGWQNPLTDFPCENERRAICEREHD